MMRFTSITVAAVLALCVATPALAQEDDLPPPPGEDAPKKGSSKKAAEPAADEFDEPPPPEAGSDKPKPTKAAPKAAPVADGASKTKLSQDETIYVVQRKPVSVKYAFEIAPQFVQSVNDRFTTHTGFALSGLFHFRENFALQFTGGAVWGRDTSLTQEIREKESLKPELVQLMDHTWFLTSDLQWSPMYGKVSLMDLVLGQFSVYVSIGGGLMGNRLRNQFKPNLAPWHPEAYDSIVENPSDTNSALDSNLAQLRFLGLPQVAATIGGGLRFYLFDWLGFRLELRDYVQANRVNHRILFSPETTSTVDISNTYMVQLGVSFLTPRLPFGGGRQ